VRGARQGTQLQPRRFEASLAHGHRPRLAANAVRSALGSRPRRAPGRRTSSGSGTSCGAGPGAPGRQDTQPPHAGGAAAPCGGNAGPYYSNRPDKSDYLSPRAQVRLAAPSVFVRLLRM